MTKWFRRHWDESRGDEYDSWGSAVYYFETDDLGQATRQLEVYATGQRLRYTADHLADQFGALSDQRLDLDDFAPYAIEEEEFRAAWQGGPALNLD